MTMTKIRGFEKVALAKALDNVQLPARQTANSAGYDFYLPSDTFIPQYGSVVIPTGIKAYMQDDEVLKLYIRSSLAIKNELELVNKVGIIDADYYNNPKNEGEIIAKIYNHGAPLLMRRGERFMQGIFTKYLLADGDNATAERQGGVGSTDAS